MKRWYWLYLAALLTGAGTGLAIAEGAEKAARPNHSCDAPLWLEVPGGEIYQITRMEYDVENKFFTAYDDRLFCDGFDGWGE